MATPNIPPQLGSKVSMRTINYRALVIDAWGADWSKPDTAYEMSNGRRFDFTDRTNMGIYNGGA